MKGHNRGKERQKIRRGKLPNDNSVFGTNYKLSFVFCLYLLILNISVSIPFEFFLEYELDRNDEWMDHDDNDYVVDCDDEDRIAGKGFLPRKMT